MKAKLIIFKQEAEFRKFRQSKFYSSKFLKIRVRAGNQNTSRFGFIIPKKIVPKVVARNKIKRRIKNILQKNLPSIKNQDVLIFPNAQTYRLTFKELEQQVINLLIKANLWI